MQSAPLDHSGTRPGDLYLRTNLRVRQSEHLRTENDLPSQTDSSPAESPRKSVHAAVRAAALKQTKYAEVLHVSLRGLSHLFDSTAGTHRVWGGSFSLACLSFLDVSFLDERGGAFGLACLSFIECADAADGSNDTCDCRSHYPAGDQSWRISTAFAARRQRDRAR